MMCMYGCVLSVCLCKCVFAHECLCVAEQAMDSLPDERSPIFVQGLDAVYQIVRQFPLCFEFTSELLVFIADHVHSGKLMHTCKINLDALIALVVQHYVACCWCECLFSSFIGLFGNFLGNCEKQRVDQLNVRRNTQSIWSFVFEHHAHFCQVGYKSYEGKLCLAVFLLQPDTEAFLWESHNVVIVLLSCHINKINALQYWLVSLLYLFWHCSDDVGALWPKTGIKQMQLWERFFCRWNMHSHPAGLSSHSWEAETEAEAGGSDSWHDDWWVFVFICFQLLS